MFKEGQVLRNKKAPTMLVYITDTKGNGVIIESKNPEVLGKTVKCSDIKFYNEEKPSIKHKPFLYGNKKIAVTLIKNYL